MFRKWVNKLMRRLSYMLCCFGIDEETLISKTVPAVPEYRGGPEGGKGFIPFDLAQQVYETRKLAKRPTAGS